MDRDETIALLGDLTRQHAATGRAIDALQAALNGPWKRLRTPVQPDRIAAGSHRVQPSTIDEWWPQHGKPG
jgi:hypothetical protein